jgi:hypothetical protein
MVLAIRLPSPEIRVTVTRDAVPRRSPTLALNAFVTHPTGPASGGPGDRRSVERAAVEAPIEATRVPVGPGRGTRGRGSPVPARETAGRPVDRTIVRSTSTDEGPAAANRLSGGAATAVGSVDGVEPLTAITSVPATGPAILRILRGDHQAMLEVVDALAGADGRRRRDWEILLTGLGQAVAETAVDEAILDFPMGIPFWDAFTVEQCREITASLASMGYRFDGRDGWVDGRTPGYRELSQALADIGVDPIRIRIWPNSTDIAQLFRGARPAADDLTARDAPDLRLEAVQELTRWHAESLADLWLAWDEVRPLLLAEPAAA